MKGSVKPIRSTMVWGLLGAIMYLPASIFLHSLLPWPLGDQLFLWALLAGYGLMLSRWASRPFSAIALPIILLLIAALCIHSTATFACAALGIFAWIRSGICFRRRPAAIRLIAESGLGVGAGLAMSAVVITAPVSAALGIWLFFLIQTLYFVIFEYRQEPTSRLEVDPFERARMAAERILSH
ncbi:MAG: hypothetical protein JRE62_10030 [Deltaproteobacteria bacterium]|nr:hypothetical protein [Deltaproteobacteria bacterium]